MITIQINLTGEMKNIYKQSTENREQNRENKGIKELLATFGEIWHMGQKDED